MTPITKEEYIKLINEDLEWLLQQPQTLERDHIEIVLKESINKYYPINEEELDRLAEKAYKKTTEKNLWKADKESFFCGYKEGYTNK